MSVDLKTARSRRAILGAGLGAVAASAAAAVALPGVALAGGGNDGSPILVGSQFTDVRGLTILQNSSTTTDVFSAKSLGAGTALLGSSASGSGVYGETSATVNSGFAGVSGFSTGGVAVSASTLSGVALQVYGRVRMSQNSGVAEISSGAASVVVNPSLDVNTSSFVLLTPKANIHGRSLWYTVNRSANTFTIHVSSAVTATTPVAWLLLG